MHEERILFHKMDRLNHLPTTVRQAPSYWVHTTDLHMKNLNYISQFCPWVGWVGVGWGCGLGVGFLKI